MPNPDVSIEFDKDKTNYRPGDLLTVRVLVRIDSPLTVLGIHVSFKGDAHVEWHTSNGKTSSTWRGIDSIINYHWTVHGTTPGTPGRPTLTMAKGDHMFQFGVTIPATRSNGAPLANSYHAVEDKYPRPKGSIRYFVECNVERPGANSATLVSRDIQLLRLVDLGKILRSAEPREFPHREYVYCCYCCCRGGPIDVVIKTDKGAYIPGESMRVSARIVNNSPKTIEEATLCLTKTATYVAHDDYRNDAVKILSTIDRVIKLKSKGTHDFGEKQVQWPLGLEPTSTPESCGVLYITYGVWMDVDTAACSCSFKVKLPITIGSIPEEVRRKEER